MNDSLAILLPVQNAQRALAAMVSSALEIAAELTPRCEIAIIDDGSTDGTEEIACDLALEFPQVLVARHHRPRGLDKAIQTGIQATHGSILMIVPPAAPLQPNQVRRLWRLATGDEALREEQPRHPSGLRVIRRRSDHRKTLPARFQTHRTDAEPSRARAAAPNILTPLRDFALGE